MLITNNLCYKNISSKFTARSPGPAIGVELHLYGDKFRVKERATIFASSH